MVRRCSDKMAKLLMVVFNFVFLVCGIAMLAIGLMDISNFNSLKSIIQGLSGVNLAFIIAGAVVCIISFLGCCGALKENSCMVSTFMALLVLILIFEIAVGILAFHKRDKIEELVTREAKKSLNHTDDSLVAKAWDDIQISFKCCGAENPKDYPEMHKAYPDSCCKVPEAKGKCDPSSKGFSNRGCIPEMKNFLKSHFLSIGVTAIVIGFIEVVGIIFACCLRSAINEKYETV